MNINAINSTRRRALEEQDFHRLQDEARMANELQAQGMGRTDALKSAKKALENKA